MADNTIQIWNMIGTWVASIGTVSAVITSLWLAHHHGKIKLKVIVGHRNLIKANSKSHPEFCMINVTNTGLRPAKITNISWEIRHFFKKKTLIQFFGFSGFEDIPKTLQEGEEATFMIPFNYRCDEKDWIVRFPKYVTEGNQKRFNTLKLVVHTSVGQSFKAKPEKNLIKKLKESLENNS